MIKQSKTFKITIKVLANVNISRPSRRFRRRRHIRCCRSSRRWRSDRFPDVEVVVAVGSTADGSQTLVLEVVQIVLASVFGVAVDRELGSHLEQKHLLR